MIIKKDTLTIEHYEGIITQNLTELAEQWEILEDEIYFDINDMEDIINDFVDNLEYETLKNELDERELNNSKELKEKIIREILENINTNTIYFSDNINEFFFDIVTGYSFVIEITINRDEIILSVH